MPIKRPNQAVREDASPSDEREYTPKINPQVNERLDRFIAAKPADFARYQRLVSENPEHAVRTLMLKDMFSHEREMRLVEKQLPEAKRWLEQQAPDVQDQIRKRLEGVDPMFHDKALVNEVFSHMTRQSMAENRKKLMPGPSQAVA